MKLLIVLSGVALLAAVCEAGRWNRRGKDDSMSMSMSDMKDNKKAWGIGHCITRFVCGLPCNKDEGGDGGAGGDGAMDCFRGGKDYKKDQKKCEEACPGQRRGGHDDKKDIVATCIAPDCSDSTNFDHYYCSINCITPKDEDKQGACAGVECDPDNDGQLANNGGADGRCRKANDGGNRRRGFLKRRLMRRLGKFAVARNFRGMDRVMRRMKKAGVHECKRNSIVKYLMYPVAILKCIVHRLFCMVKPSACDGGNYVEIVDGGTVDCKDDANKDNAECKKDNKDQDQPAGHLVDCTSADNENEKACKLECWDGGKDQKDNNPDCPDCPNAQDDWRCKKDRK